MDVKKIIELIKKLRGAEGCPWDRKQTLHTLRWNLVEESYELMDAIRKDDINSIKEELGDILFLTLFHINLLEEKGISSDELIESLYQKMVKRHPHIFKGKIFKDSKELLKHWESSKGESFMDVTRHLPALYRAQRIGEKTERIGFDWKDAQDVLDKVKEEISELEESLKEGDTPHIKEELGDLLFTIANLARHTGVEAEEALTDATDKFVERLQKMNKLTNENLDRMTQKEMDELWERIKLSSRYQRRKKGAKEPEKEETDRKQ